MNYTEPDLSAEVAAQGGKPGTRKPKSPQKEAFSAEEMGANAGELRQFIERVERLEEEKVALADDVKGVLAEAKGRGYDVKTIRAIIKLRKQDPDERHEAEGILEIYMNALGMV